MWTVNDHRSVGLLSLAKDLAQYDRLFAELFKYGDGEGIKVESRK